MSPVVEALETGRSPGDTTRFVRYLYIDVVGFTSNRGVEAQSDVVLALNRCIRDSLQALSIEDASTILIPSGDGIAVALIDPALPLDIHIQLALKVLEAIAAHSSSVAIETRRFEVRVGVNQNIDNLVVDVNGHQNVAGMGINMAQRVMSLAGPSQVLVGQPVYDTLVQRERYMTSFRRYQASIKHGLVMPLYQLIQEGTPGLSVSIPPAFEEPVKPPEKLSDEEAAYLAFAISLKPWLLGHRGSGQNSYAMTLLLWYAARDLVSERRAPVHREPTPKLSGGGRKTLDEAFQYYMSLDFWIACDLAGFAVDSLKGVRVCLEQGAPLNHFFFVHENGVAKLKAEYPALLEEVEKRLARFPK